MAIGVRKSNGRRSNEDRREWSTTHILQIAQQQIVRAGYVATTMDRIAAHSELTKGAVYFYFPSKEALMNALLDRADKEYFTPALELLKATQGSATDRLIAYFNHAGAHLEHGVYLLPLTLSIQSDVIPESLHSRILDLYNNTHSLLSRVIGEGQRDGEFTATEAPETHASHLIATMDGMLLEWERSKDSIDGRQFMRVARRGVLRSLDAS